MEGAIGSAGKLDSVDDCVEIERAVEVRKARARTGVGGIGGGFEDEPRSKPGRVNPQNNEIALPAVKEIGSGRKLRAGRAMNETLGLERGRAIVAARASQFPLGAAEDMEDHWITVTIVRRRVAAGNQRRPLKKNIRNQRAAVHLTPVTRY
jgi:hypothetical protein